MGILAKETIKLLNNRLLFLIIFSFLCAYLVSSQDLSNGFNKDDLKTGGVGDLTKLIEQDLDLEIRNAWNNDKATIEKRKELYDGLSEGNKRKLWKILDEDGRKKLLEVFDSDDNAGKKYLELLDSLDPTIILDSNILDQNAKIEDRNKERNEFLKLLNNQQSETVLSQAVGVNVIIPESIEGKDISYDTLYNRKFGTKYDKFIIKDSNRKEHFLSRKENLPENIGKIELKESLEIKGFYNMRYFDKENKNSVFLDDYYLKKGKENEWLIESNDLKENIIVGLDKNWGRIEIDNIDETGKKDKREIQIWGTPSLTGDDIKKGINVKIADGKGGYLTVSPHPNGRAIDGKYYASVNNLEDNVFNVEGNVITEKIGLFTENKETISFKNKEQISHEVRKKIGNNLITISEDSENGKIGLDVSGDFKGKLSFAVSEDSVLKMSNDEFTIKAKNGEDYYTYLVGEGNGGKLKKALTDYVKGKLGRLEDVELVKRTDEIEHSLAGNNKETQRVGDGKYAPDPIPPPDDEPTGETTETTETENSPAHINEKINGVINEVNEGGSGSDTNNGLNFQITTPKTETSNNNKVLIRSLPEIFYKHGNLLINEKDYFGTIEYDRVVAVKFGTTWCQPCLRMDGEFNKKNYPGRGYINIDAEKMSNIAGKYNIDSYPTIIFFKNGREVRRVSGYHGPKELAGIHDSL